MIVRNLDRMMGALVLVKPALMRLTRRKLLAGGAGGRARRGAGSTSSSTSSAARRRARRPAACRRSSTCSQGVRIVEDNGVEVVVPPLHHQLVTAHGEGRTSAACRTRSASSRTSSQKLEQDFDADARRARDHGRLGAAVLPRLRPEARRRAHPRRPARDEDREQAGQGAARLAAVPERPARDDPRGERRRRAPAQRPPRAHRRRRRRRSSRTSTSSDATSIRRGFAGGGFDGGPEPPEEDGRRRERARLVPDPRPVRALPRLHLDAEGRPRPAEDREPRGARLQQRRLLQRGHAPRRRAHLRGSRGLVRELPAPGARLDRASARG